MQSKGPFRESLSLEKAKALFLDRLGDLVDMKATPWPFLCACALVEYLTKMVNGGKSDPEKYEKFVREYLGSVDVDERYKTFTFANGKTDLPEQMYHVLRCGIVHSFSLVADKQAESRGGRSRSIVIAHGGQHLKAYSKCGLDAVLLVLGNFVSDLKKVIEKLFSDAKTKPGLKQSIERHLCDYPPIVALT
jgi:hypothetical protein